jgi:competence protein ComEC
MRAWILILIFSYGSPMASGIYKQYLIIWNVGQGSWATLVKPDECLHMDMGGEYNQTAKVLKFCRGKTNKLFLSHADWDHYSFAKFSPLFDCRLNQLRPIDEMNLSFFTAKKVCMAPDHENLFPQGKNINTKIKNKTSQVAWIKRFKMLIPGDAPSAQEKLWNYSKIWDARILILGHHGSKTSSSEFLLTQLGHLKLAIASARKLKYGHPHQIIINRLKNHSIPLLTTQDWGSIAIVD